MALTRNIPSTGLTLVYEPPEVEPVADVVLVHGLQGDPVQTWLWKGRIPTTGDRSAEDVEAIESRATVSTGERATGSLDDPPAREGLQPSPLPYSRLSENMKRVLTGISPSKRKRAPPETEIGEEYITHYKARINEVFWPKDLLPKDCKDTRILTWGYDSRVTKWYKGPVNRSGIFSHAQDLLCALAGERKLNRPVVFVAHSLGGLIVKEVLRRADAAEEEQYHNVIVSTVAVVFFGTPHRGSADKATLGDAIRRICSTVLRVDSNPSLLRALGDDSPELEISRQEFPRLWHQYKFRVKTFQESFGFLGVKIGGLNSKVVPDVSSSLDDPMEHKETIQANHMDMCRFSGRSDPEYQKVVREMKIIFATLPSRREKGLRGCLAKLKFEEINTRELNTPCALPGTCDWVFKTSQYNSWFNRDDIDRHRGLLWIKGKPGAGKSVILKELSQRLYREQLEGTTVASHFFNARGGHLQKSQEGLFRDLLFQLVQQDEIFKSQMMSLYWQLGGVRSYVRDWQEHELRQVFFDCIAASGNPQRAIIVVDALDECEPSRLREVVSFLRSLTASALDSGWDLNVCVSSRHYPMVGIPNCLEIVVEDGNNADIDCYIRTKLPSPGPTLEPHVIIERQISERASGVFLWVALVVELLVEDLEDGKTMRDMLTTLKTVPDDLAELFKNLFLTLKRQERERSVALFQWVLLAHWPLSPLELCLVLGFKSSRQHHSLGAWERSIDRVHSEDQARKLIRSHSRGLIGFRTGERCGETVEFIHESVREYLLSGEGFSHLDASLRNQGIGHGHQSMSTICLNLLKVHELDASPRGDMTSPLVYRYYGPLFYAAVCVLQHAKQADDEGYLPESFLQMLATRKLDLLGRIRWLRSSHGQPGFHPNTYSPLKLQLSEDGSPLYDLCVMQFRLSVRKLLQLGANPNDSGRRSSYPLIAAVQNRKSSVVIIRALIQQGAIVSATGCRGRTALHHASALGLRNVADILLCSGADIDCTDDEYKTPLHLAAKKGHSKIAAHLLAKEADPDMWTYSIAADGRFSELSPLHIAVLRGDMLMVRTLVENGNSALEIYDNNGKTPYDMAYKNNQHEIRAYLLEKTMEWKAEQENEGEENNDDQEGSDEFPTGAFDNQQHEQLRKEQAGFFSPFPARPANQTHVANSELTCSSAIAPTVTIHSP